MLTSQNLQAVRAVAARQLPAASNEGASNRAKKFLDLNVISSTQFEDIPFENGEVWSLSVSRSQQRYLHGLLFLVDWYKTVLTDEATRATAALAAWRVVESWASLHTDRQTSPLMAYHDETTAQRMINLVALSPFIDELLPEHSDDFAALMSSTAELLSTDEFHASGNNHGMFQDLALLYWSILSAPADDRRAGDYFVLAMNRLRKYFEECFTADGVHVENTPTYHLMVARHVTNVQKIASAAEHPDATFYQGLVRRAEVYAVHALMPNGTYPPVSDTQQKNIAQSGMQKVFTSEEFSYASTGGLVGRAPDKRCLVLPDSGYAIYRSKWGDPNATFAFFSASYNADYHKHSDDLSFFLRSGGIDLLSEAGPYSYDYKDPLSRYAYSQFAHNSLVVDGMSLPRTDDRSESVYLRSENVREDGFTVVGTNARYDDVVHQRTVDITEPNGSTEVSITDSVSGTGEHKYQLLWNLGTEVQVTLHGQGFELFHEGQKILDLMVAADVPTSLSIHEGVMKPRPFGWRFPKFGEAVPAKVIAIDFQGQSASLKTSIKLSDFNYVDRGLSAQDSKWLRHDGDVALNYLLSPGKSANGRRRLAVIFSAIQERGDFTYNYKATVDEVDISALYILDDFGDQGAYYHSDHHSDAIFRSVESLIKTIADQQGLAMRDIVTVGTSKGGTAALLHGLNLSVGKIITGAPQTRIGSFLTTPHPNILEFMTGGIAESDVTYLDGLVDGVIEKSSGKTALSILVGQNDHHLPHHVLPLASKMSAKGDTNISITILPDLSHADIGTVFRFFLAANLEQWVLGSSEEALPYILTADEARRSIRLKVYAPVESQISYRLFRGSEVVRRRSYSDREVVIFENLAAGSYRVRVFHTDPNSPEPRAFTSRWITIPKIMQE